MRKPLVVLAACGLLLPAAQAQTERGARLLGVSVGNLSYSRSEYGGSGFSAALYPTAAYFVVDKLALGATLNLDYGRQRYASALRYSQFSYGLSPFVRYYALGSGRHRGFVEAGGDVGRSHYKSRQYDYMGTGLENVTRDFNTYGYHAALGYTYFLAPTAALEATAGYYHVSSGSVYDKRNVIDVRVGFSIYLPAGGSN